MNRFEITEVLRPGPNGKPQWEPAGKHFPGRPQRVFADAQTAMIARDRACRFFLVSLDQVRLQSMKDPETAKDGVLLVVGEMGVVSTKELEAPNGAKGPPGVAEWPRVTPFRSGFETVVVRSRDLSDDELRAALAQFLGRHAPRRKRKVMP